MEARKNYVFHSIVIPMNLKYNLLAHNMCNEKLWIIIYIYILIFCNYHEKLTTFRSIFQCIIPWLGVKCSRQLYAQWAPPVYFAARECPWTTTEGGALKTL